MANYEVRLLIEDFETSRNPEVVIDFFKDDESMYWARVVSSNADDEFDEVLDSEEVDSGFVPDEDLLFELARTFVKSLC